MTWLCLLFVCMEDLDNVELISMVLLYSEVLGMFKLFWGRGPTLPREVSSRKNPPPPILKKDLIEIKSGWRVGPYFKCTSRVLAACK